MHHARSPVASARPRRRSASVRRPMEALESRVLFAAGDFDTTFGGGNGAALVHFTPDDRGTTVATLADGSVLVGGSIGDGTNTNDDWGIAKLKPDGTPDASFGTNGLVTIDFGAGDSDLNAIAVAPDGKIVAVGKTAANGNADWAVARLTAGGALDPTFDIDGKVVTDFFGFADAAYSVDVQSNGRIVVTGTDTGVNQDVAVVRYTTTGALDGTFDGDGKQFVNYFGGADYAGAVKVQADNKIVVVGGSQQPGSYRRFVLTRFNANGSFDTTFGTGGEATADFGADAWAKDVELTTDGKYVVGGWLDTDTTGEEAKPDFTVARFNANGLLDASFGTAGRTTIATGGDQNAFYGVEIQQNGKVLIGGTARDAGGLTYAGVARLTAAGAPDATFGPGGLRQFTIPGTVAGTGHVNDLELAADGKIVLGGYGVAAAGGTGNDFAAVRLLNDDLPAGSISGTVFNDANNNGVRDAGEAGVGGVTVFQDLNNNGVYDAGPATYASTDVPVVIPDNQVSTVTSTITVSGASGPITDLNLTLDVSHTWDDDLIISLVGPTGKTVKLIEHRGLDRDNFTNTVLDDEAAQSIAPPASAPFTGSFRPEEPLSAFDGLDPNGVWTLKIQDTFDTEGGRLNAWSLAISGPAEPGAVSGADGSYSFPSVQPGTYTLREVVPANQTQTAPVSGFYAVDVVSGQASTGRDFGNVQGIIASTVAGRRVFYNHSSFDGNSAAANAQDDAAVATDKQALLPGQGATLANVTSYSRGINGVMVDVVRLPASTDLTADDFEFRVGNNATPGTWALAPAPLSVTERPSGLADGSTRVSVVWADGAIRNQWLQVTVKANANTRLAQPDVFYFGNLMGETVAGGSGDFAVNASDVTATRLAKRNVAAAVTEPADHNRDGRVNVLDDEVVRGNYGKTLAAQGTPAAAVAARSVFYNASAFDGGSAAANAQDDAAIASDKQALLPGQVATPANVTSYSRGINGVMVDLARMNSTLTADDFDFKVGNTATPGTWAAAPAPVSVTQRASGRPDGSTRVSLVWADGAIRNQWLQVTVKANARTGLAQPDVFYFGNLVGQAAHAAGAAAFAVNGNDVAATRAAPRNRAALVTEAADANRDGRVNVLDDVLVRRNYNKTLVALAVPVPQGVFAAAGVIAAAAARERGVPATRAVLG